ncbi:hypothetical protein HDU82_007126 [Entophlyctis luteolus]|nr:hypothetical protein HDU82_007126 [Entophlyctis luteolus]
MTPFIRSNRVLSKSGLGTDATIDALMNRICPGLITGQSGPRYFGFVTGGTTDPALLADILVSSYDQNVQVHLPQTSVSTEVEVAALDMAADLMGIDARSIFKGKTVTTGATASNVLGLCVGREAVGRVVMGDSCSVSDDGFNGFKIVVLHASGHASIAKAAAIAGIGRKNCLDIASIPNTANFNLEILAAKLKEYARNKVGVIISVSNGEVNTGAHTRDIARIRQLADLHGAWVHMDAAFGAFDPRHAAETPSSALCFADSITSDAHKWLNVPYDCGLFYTRRPDLLVRSVAPTFEHDSTPAYLAARTAGLHGGAEPVASPLTVGIENSRRFRALPLYASLLALGRDGYVELFERNVAFANMVAEWIHASPDYTLLNNLSDGIGSGSKDGVYVGSIVLFRAAPGNRGGFTDTDDRLLDAINSTRVVYVTGTVWGGKSAIRIALSNWRTGLTVDGTGKSLDFEILTQVLQDVMK